MKIALVYDAITEFGGAERVLQTLLHAYPYAHVYTLLAHPHIIRTHFPSLTKNTLHVHPFLPYIASTHTSFLQAAAPFIWNQFDFSSYELVLSTPAHLMCNVIRVPNIHIQYIHSLPKNIFGILPPTPLQQYTHYDTYCAPLYRRAVHKTPYILTNSNHMKQTIMHHTNVRATVIHPPITLPSHLPFKKQPSYYMCVSRLDTQKHIELAIRACTFLQLPLMIVGVSNEPRYEQYLRSISGPTVTFLGYQTDKEIYSLYQRAKAVIFPSENEDFGMAPVEAMAHGVPVIAYFGGGAKETIIEGVTGHFFHTHTYQALVHVLKKFDSSNFHSNILYRHAATYGEKKFLIHLQRYIDSIYHATSLSK